MTTLPRLSEESEESFDLSIPPKSSSEGKRPSSKHSSFNNYNFSRPRPVRLESDQSQQSQYTARSYASHSSSGRGNVHTISAFHEPSRDLPDEPRFSDESDRTTIPSSEYSAGSEFAWDGERGELRLKPRPKKPFDQQRYERDPQARAERSGSHSSKSSGGSSIAPLRQQATYNSLASFNNGITKRVSVDQRSERLSTSTDGHEDIASHHTVSDDDEGSFDMEGNWQSSNYDTTGLSDAQIRKLLKKGINPNLYAEMKAAKKGRNKLIGPLLGNSFIS
jgi:hypothetical protein